MSDDLTAAYANIGRFFCAFAELEKAVDATFIKMFKLDGHDNAAVIARAVQFRTRLDFIKKFVASPRASNNVRFSEQWKIDAEAVCGAADELRIKRNRFAHATLTPMNDGMVRIEDSSGNKSAVEDQAIFEDLLDKITSTAAGFQTFQDRLDANLFHPSEMGVFLDVSFWDNTFFTEEEDTMPPA